MDDHLMEVVEVNADSAIAPRVTRHPPDMTIDQLIDAARAASRLGRPREVLAQADGIVVARFMGAWLWQL